MKWLLTALLSLFLSSTVLADDSKSPDYADLKEKYELTDEEYEVLKTSGLNSTQAGKAVHLQSLQEDKSLEEVLKMRSEDGRGWGEIAKELGVHPGELGKGHSKTKKMDKAERRANRAKKKMSRKAENMDRKAEKMAEKAQRRANKGKDK